MYYQDYLIYKYFIYLSTKLNFFKNTFFLYDIRLIRSQGSLYIFIYFFDQLIEEFVSKSHWWFREFLKLFKNKLKVAYKKFFDLFVFQLIIKVLLNKLRHYLIKILTHNFVLGSTKLSVKFLGSSVEYYDPLLIAWYVRLKLKQRYSFLQVVRPLFRFFNNKLKKLKLVRGLKIQCAGRLSRKERASYLWHNKGKLFSTGIASNVGYAMVLVFLQNSAVAVKV